MSNCDSLLIIAMPGRMGDIVACEPLFRRLHELHPERKIHFYTSGQYLSLLSQVPYIDRVIAVKDYIEYGKLKKDFPQDSLCIELNCRHQTKVSATSPLSDEFVPLLHAFAQSINVEVPDETPRFYVDESAPCPELPERYLVFHCRSDGRSRQWSGKYWNKLADMAFNKGFPVVEIGEMRTIYHPSPLYINLTGRINLHTAAKVIRNCHAFVGVESGFGHFANALGCFGFILTGKLRRYPEYVTYSGDFGHYGSRSNLLAFYDIPSDRLPFPVVSRAFEWLLANRPFTFEECRLYCLKEQIRQMRQGILFRIQEALCSPFLKLQRALRHHQRHQLKKM